MLRDLRNRIANSIARAIVQLVDDSGGIQLMQIGVLAGETRGNVERFQQYGLTSVPRAGGEAVVLFPDGDRGHGLIIAVDSSTYRLTGLESGEVAIYNDAGAKMILKKDGSIEANPAAGKKMYIRGDGGSSAAVALLSDVQTLRDDFDGHGHSYVAAGPGTITPTTDNPSSPSPAGTTRFEAE